MGSNREEEGCSYAGTYNVTIVLDGYQFFKQKDIRAANNLNAMITALTKLDSSGIKQHFLASTQLTMEVRREKKTRDVENPQPKINLLPFPHRENTIIT